MSDREGRALCERWVYFSFSQCRESRPSRPQDTLTHLRSANTPHNSFVRRSPPQFPAPRRSWPTTERRRSRLVNVSVESHPLSYNPSGVLMVGDGKSRWFYKVLRLVYKPRCSYRTYLRFKLVNTHDYTSSSHSILCDSEFRSRPRRRFGVVVADMDLSWTSLLV